MSGRTKVACVMDMLDRTRPSACGYLRLLLPLSKPVVADAFDVSFVTPTELEYTAADIIIVQRAAIGTLDAVDRLVRRIARTGARLVYELDDDLLALSEGHPEYAHYAPVQPIVLRLAAEADEVWVSTPALAARVAPIGRVVKVFANELDARVWAPVAPAPRNEGVTRLLFMGTTSHARDYEAILRPAFAKLRARHGAKVTLTVVGAVPDANRDAGVDVIAPPVEVAASYPSFAAWLARLPAFDIGVAPLGDSLFAQSKSEVKWLEYIALGLAVTATDVGAYAAAADGDGVVVAPDANAFHAVLDALVTDAQKRNTMRDRARARATDMMARSAAEEPRLARLEALARQDGARTRVSADVPEATGGLDRRMLSHAFICGDGIEVGALHNPLNVGPSAHVKYVDRMPKPQLFEQYPELRELNLVDVDIVDDGEKLVTLAADSQDFIIANHFIEHCEDPIRTLRNFLRVLRPGGVVFMAAPDIRASFDKDRELTSLEHLIADHRDTPAGSREHHFREWVTLVEPHFGRIYGADEASARVRELMSMDYSIHYHTFTPASMAAFLRHCAEREGLPVSVAFGVAFDEEMVFILRKEDVPNVAVAPAMKIAS